jgi:hypothetical protein
LQVSIEIKIFPAGWDCKRRDLLQCSLSGESNRNRQYAVGVMCLTIGIDAPRISTGAQERDIPVLAGFGKLDVSYQFQRIPDQQSADVTERVERARIEEWMVPYAADI